MRDDRDQRGSFAPLRKRGNGYVAEGRGYYIWDEDPSEVIRLAREFDRGRVPPRARGLKATTRFLVVHASDRPIR